MGKKILCLLIVAACWWSVTATAEEIYKWVDDKGVIHFSNVPVTTQQFEVRDMPVKSSPVQSEVQTGQLAPAEAPETKPAAPAAPSTATAGSNPAPKASPQQAGSSITPAPDQGPAVCTEPKVINYAVTNSPAAQVTISSKSAQSYVPGMPTFTGTDFYSLYLNNRPTNNIPMYHVTIPPVPGYNVYNVPVTTPYSNSHPHSYSHHRDHHHHHHPDKVKDIGQHRHRPPQKK